MGKINEVRPGVWKIRFDGPEKNGVRQQKQTSFKGTKKAAKAELDRLTTEVKAGTYVQPAKGTVADHLLRWLLHVRSTAKSAKGYERYTDIVNNHLIPRFGHFRLDQITTPQVNDYISEARISGSLKGRPLAPQTVHHHVRLLRQALEYAVDEGTLRANPARKAKLPTPDNKEMVTLKPEEVRRLFRAAEGTPLAMVAILAVATGARRGELLGLRWADYDEKEKRLTIVRSLEETTAGGIRLKDTKTAAGRRAIPLPDFAIQALTQHRGEQARQRLLLGPVFVNQDYIITRADGRPASPDHVSREFSTLVKRTGLPPVTLHGMRHTFASLHLKDGANMKTIATLLGHSSVIITMARYSHLQGGEQEEVARRMDAILKVEGL